MVSMVGQGGKQTTTTTKAGCDLPLRFANTEACQAGPDEIQSHRRDRRIIRFIIGTLVPVPVAALVSSLGFFWDSDAGMVDLLLPCFIFFLIGIVVGYYAAGIPSVCYSLVMEFLGLSIPFISNSIVLYMLLSAVVGGLCTLIGALYSPEFANEMVVSLGVFSGAVSGVILYPLTQGHLDKRLEVHRKGPHA